MTIKGSHLFFKVKRQGRQCSYDVNELTGRNWFPRELREVIAPKETPQPQRRWLQAQARKASDVSLGHFA